MAQTPLIRQSPLTDTWYVLTSYKNKGPYIEARVKHDVTNQVHAIIGKVRDERDALLDACKAQDAFDDHCVECDDCRDGSHCDTGIELSTTAQRLIKTAIAKAEG